MPPAALGPGPATARALLPRTDPAGHRITILHAQDAGDAEFADAPERRVGARSAIGADYALRSELRRRKRRNIASGSQRPRVRDLVVEEPHRQALSGTDVPHGGIAACLVALVCKIPLEGFTQGGPRAVRRVRLSTRCGRIVAPPCRAFDTGLQPTPFPDQAGGLLPGLLAATRTALRPAGDDELTNSKIHYDVYDTVSPPVLLGARKPGLTSQIAVPRSSCWLRSGVRAA
jgi:hypothetical protein